MIDLQKVCKNHGVVPALIEISLKIARDESVCLLGHSGSGKTTLLRLIAGLESPDSGTVLVHGRIGMVFQSLALWPHVSVRDHLELVLHDARWKNGRREQRITEIMTLFGIDAWADRKPGSLSGGQQQRVALARALAPDPEILLLDEPMSHIDLPSRAALRARLMPHLEQRCVVIATHDEQNDALLSRRRIRLNEGRIT